MKRYVLLLLLCPLVIFAQDYESPALHGNEYGGGITIAMSGFGFGGFYRFALPNFSHLGANINFYVMRDDKEFEYYDYYFNRPVQINKFNRLFLIPATIEYKKRLLAESLDDGMRPYIIGSAGLTFGMNYPRNNEYNLTTLSPAEQAKYPTENEYRLTYNATIGIGVDITTQRNLYISIRPQFRFMSFTKDIAAKKDHSGFEILIEIGRRNIK